MPCAKPRRARATAHAATTATHAKRVARETHEPVPTRRRQNDLKVRPTPPHPATSLSPGARELNIKHTLPAIRRRLYSRRPGGYGIHMTEVLARLFAYNDWSNRRFIEALLAHDAPPAR